MLNDFGEVFKDVSLKNYNTYRINTYADYLVKPSNITCLVNLIKYLKENNYKYYILGKGSNVILPDTKFKGVIINLDNINNFEIKDNDVYAEAGIMLSTIAKETINKNLKGLENLANIPGTLGGALVGNAGAYGTEIYDVVEDVTILRDDSLITLKKEDIKYSYRYTMFKDSMSIIVSCHLKLSKGNSKELLKIVKDNQVKRMNTQPLKYPNAGSVFKNPSSSSYSAGKLIDEINLKGYHINDAYISTMHGNFIVNMGNATSKDILDLITYIKEQVYNKYNIELELEQRIVKWD